MDKIQNLRERVEGLGHRVVLVEIGDGTAQFHVNLWGEGFPSDWVDDIEYIMWELGFSNYHTGCHPETIKFTIKF